MKLLFVFLSLLIPSALLIIAQPQQQAIQQTRIAIAHVAMIDSNGGSVRQDMTVIIVGNRIVEVGKGSDVNLRASVQVIDGRGKFLIPGLWDRHVHVLSGGAFA
jgi:imidazolonepropionase-like amidohydrolase